MQQGRQIRRLSAAKPPLGQDREQYVLATARRIGIAPEQPQNERNRGGKGGFGRFRIGVPSGGPPFERREHVQRLPGARSGRDDPYRRAVVKGSQIVLVDSPFGEAGTPLC